MYKAEKARQMLQLSALKACFHVGHDSPANLLLGTSCTSMQSGEQGCISCGILLSGTGARGVSSEHMENMEMFSCSPT